VAASAKTTATEAAKATSASINRHISSTSYSASNKLQQKLFVLECPYCGSLDHNFGACPVANRCLFPASNIFSPAIDFSSATKNYNRDPLKFGGVDWSSFDFVDPLFAKFQHKLRYTNSSHNGMLLRDAGYFLGTNAKGNVGTTGISPSSSPSILRKRSRNVMNQVDPEIDEYLSRHGNIAIDRHARMISLKAAMEIRAHSET